MQKYRSERGKKDFGQLHSEPALDVTHLSEPALDLTYLSEPALDLTYLSEH
jgi:hypothetical protein